VTLGVLDFFLLAVDIGMTKVCVVLVYKDFKEKRLLM